MLKYAPGTSRFNPVERIWSGMTKVVANTVLDPEQKIIKKGMGNASDASDRIDREVYKKCAQQIQSMLENFQYNNHSWAIGTVDPDNQMRELNGAVWMPEHEDKETLRQFYLKKHGTRNRPQFNNQEEKEIYKDARYYINHCEVGNHFMAFFRCQDESCDRCVLKHKHYPVPENFAQKLGLPSRENGALFYIPEKMEEEDGKYKTFLQLNSEMKQNPEKRLERDSDLENKGYGQCSKGCLISFKSKVDIRRWLHKKNDDS